ncbi:hypothetical protein H4S06_004197, partial [Coemansia sp. BCRC 34490]
MKWRIVLCVALAMGVAALATEIDELMPEYRIRALNLAAAPAQNGPPPAAAGHAPADQPPRDN